jgi:hypothetical protein
MGTPYFAGCRAIRIPRNKAGLASRKTRGPYFAALDVPCHPEWSTVVKNAAHPETFLGVVSHGTGKCPSPVFPRVHPDPNTSAVRSTAIVLV